MIRSENLKHLKKCRINLFEILLETALKILTKFSFLTKSRLKSLP